MRLLGLSIFLLLLFSNNLLGCDCKDLSRKKGIENYNLIFEGIIVEINEDASVYKIAVNEVFKGIEYDTLIGLLKPCSISPKENSTWLFFAQIINNDTIFVSDCSRSRSFDYPISLWSLPAPTSSEQSIKSLINSFSLYSSENFALNEIFFDVISLKLDKLSKESGLLNLEIRKLQQQTLTQRNIIISLLVLLVIISFFILTKRK